jgi:pimeloyl-ACP methyl ester carboxylesterase
VGELTVDEARHGIQTGRVNAGRVATTLCAVLAVAAVVCAGADARASAPPKTLSKLCGLPYVTGAVVEFTASDGARLVGAAAGDGNVGVVIANTSSTDICTWVANGNKTINGLIASGYRVLLFDYRSSGHSPKASGRAVGAWQDRDVLGAAAEMRRLGASQVVLVGASIGGVAALLAGATMNPHPSAIVGLSAAGTGPTDTALERNAADAKAAVASIRTPILFVAAKNDSYASSTQALYRAARRSRDKQIMVVPGMSHGFFDNDAAGTKIRTRILDFIKTHTHS